ncbi:MAG TPA: PIN domain nuclease [Candidatus Dormibacteraeota bacterium]|nr:PIN domain nuclease [Candidatus Dormibacteraeota bacterium]
MALTVEALVDKSALARITHSAVRGVLEPLLVDGRLATCAVTDLEMLFSARNGAEWEVVREQLKGLPNVPITPEVCSRAIDVQGLLWHSGRVRAVGIPDLLIAAAADVAGLPVLHYDTDFDLVAAVTGQESRWVVEAGSVP